MSKLHFVKIGSKFIVLNNVTHITREGRTLSFYAGELVVGWKYLPSEQEIEKELSNLAEYMNIHGFVYDI